MAAQLSKLRTIALLVVVPSGTSRAAVLRDLHARIPTCVKDADAASCLS